MKAVIIKLLVFVATFSLSLQAQTPKISSLIEEANSKKFDLWDFTDFIGERIDSPEEIANFFYHWIRLNIEYDTQSYEDMRNEKITWKEYQERQDEYDVYETRKAVCAGYANLYKWFLEELEVESEIISGHIRDDRNNYIDLNEDDAFRHAWNAVKLNGEWILVDTTWGSGQDEENSEYYYNIRPEWLINTHFPTESEWQLLDKPLSLEEFNNSKFVSSLWFQLGFIEAPKLYEDEAHYYFTFYDIESDWKVNLEFSNDNINFYPVKVQQTVKQDGLVYYKFEKENIGNEAYFKVGLLMLEIMEDSYRVHKHTDLINFKK